MTVSLIGDGIFIVTLAWQVYELSDAPTALSLVGLAMTVPNVLFLLIGGVVSDRFDRRRVLVAADLVRGLAVGRDGPALAVRRTRAVAPDGARRRLRRRAPRSSDRRSTRSCPTWSPPTCSSRRTRSTSSCVPPRGGWRGRRSAGSWWRGAPAGRSWSTRATFAVSIVALLLMSPHPIDAPEGEPTSALADVREGFRFVRARVWLWGTLVAAAFAYLLFIGPQEVLLPLLVKNNWGGSPLTLGFILAMGGVGAIGAALFMGQRRSPRRFITFMYVAWTLSTLAVAGLRAGPRALAGHARVLPVQRARDRGHDRVGDHEAAARARGGCSDGCPASTGSSRSACSRSRSR